MTKATKKQSAKQLMNTSNYQKVKNFADLSQLGDT